MKYKCLIMVFVLASLAGLAQSTYQQHFPFSLNDLIIDKRSNNLLILTKDNHVVLTAIKTYSDNNVYASGIFLKTDMAGAVKQQKVFRNPDDFQPSDIIETSDSGFVICGHTHALNSVSSGVILKTDKNGNVLWSRKVSDTDAGHAFKAVEVNDSTYFAVANDSTDFGSILAVKIHKNGQILGETLIGWPLTTEEARSVVYSKGSVYVFGSYTDPVNTNYAVVVAKIKVTGTLEWVKIIHSAGDYVVKRSDNRIALGGYSCTDMTCNSDGFFLAEIDTNANFVKGKVFITPETEEMTSLSLNGNNGYLIGGNLNNQMQEGPVFTLMVDSSLNVISRNEMDITSTSMFPPQGPSFIRKQNNVYLGGIVYNTSAMSMPMIYKLDTLGGNSCSTSTVAVSLTPLTLTSPTLMAMPEYTANTTAPLSVYTFPATFYDTLTCVLPTSLSGVKAETFSGLHVYPNPAAGNILHVKSEDVFVRVTFINSIGETVYSKQCRDTHQVISLNEIPSGVYMILTEHESGNKRHKVFIRN